MPEALKPWMLPGPAAFVARVCGVAHRRKVAVLHAPFDSEGLMYAIRDHLALEGRASPRILDLPADGSFEVRLGEEVGFDGPSRLSAASLATSPMLDTAAVLVR